MASFDDFMKAVGVAISKLAATTLANYKDEALNDGNTFLNKLKSDLTTWTEQLKAGSLSIDDFKFLVSGKKDLAVLDALKQRGLAKVAMDDFTNGLVGAIVDTAKATFLPG